jgi:phosphoribosyl-ATP pyrophosphohydrolase
MSKERNLILNKKIINETVETIIDSIYEKTEDYMYEYGKYTESNDEFFEDREEYMIEVINELYNRIK